jgi:hypothetical protein
VTHPSFEFVKYDNDKSSNKSHASSSAKYELKCRFCGTVEEKRGNSKLLEKCTYWKRQMIDGEVIEKETKKTTTKKANEGGKTR